MCQSCVIVPVTTFADNAPSFVTQTDALSDGDSIGERTAQVAWLNECVVKGEICRHYSIGTCGGQHCVSQAPPTGSKSTRYRVYV